MTGIDIVRHTDLRMALAGIAPVRTVQRSFI